MPISLVLVVRYFQYKNATNGQLLTADVGTQPLLTVLNIQNVKAVAAQDDSGL